MANIPIFLSSDDNYAPFVATTIASICDNTNSFCDFYILDGGISPENRGKIESLKSKFQNFSIEFIKIDVEKYFKDFLVNGYLTLATYFRFLVPEIFPDLEKILYLDIDIIALGDISRLYNEDLETYVLGAVIDQGDKHYISQLKENMEINLLSNYFNAGVLLIDCKKWREQNITKKLFDIEKKYHKKLTCNDQDILNKCFENNYKILDKKYNVFLNNKSIIIKHYAGLVKPWQADFYLDAKTKKPKPTMHIDFFWKYAKLTLFYKELLLRKKDFLSSNILYNRFNKMVKELKN